MAARTVLLVDRDPLQRQLVDMLLAEDGHTIVNASTGREALEFLKEHTPHLVIMEIALPDIGGDVVCGKLKSVSRLSPVPVILTSDQPPQPGMARDHKDLARTAGADQFVLKPLGDKNLRERVQQLLSRWDTPAPPPRHRLKNTVVLEEAIVDLESGTTETHANDAVTGALYKENEDLRREVSALKRRLARYEAGSSDEEGADDDVAFVAGSEPAAPQAMEGDGGTDEAATENAAATETDAEQSPDDGDLESRVRDLERRNKALLSALEEAEAKLTKSPRGRRRR